MRDDIQFPELSISPQGVVHVYKTNYVIKLCRNQNMAQREMNFLAAAGPCAVDVLGPVQVPYGGGGFLMPLLATIDPNAIPLEEKLRLFGQMHPLLSELHDMGIVHGDIKLSNMLVDGHGQLKLCDFGSSVWIAENYAPPHALSIRWCSPYRVGIGRASPLGFEDDIYAIGWAVWELFTGRPPYHDVADEDVEAAILSGYSADLGLVENKDARAYIEECWRVYSVGVQNFNRSVSWRVCRAGTVRGGSSNETLF